LIQAIQSEKKRKEKKNLAFTFKDTELRLITATTVWQSIWEAKTRTPQIEMKALRRKLNEETEPSK